MEVPIFEEHSEVARRAPRLAPPFDTGCGSTHQKRQGGPGVERMIFVPPCRRLVFEGQPAFGGFQMGTPASEEAASEVA